MVKLHVKRGDQSLFLYETNTEVKIENLLEDFVVIYNGRLKLERLCFEIEELSKYGVSFPPNMQGLTPEQITDLRLKDDWAEKNLNDADYVLHPDPNGRRNGLAPIEKHVEVLTKTTAEVKARILQKSVESGIILTVADIQEALDMLRGALMVTYPMGLPSYDIIKLELEGKEDLSGTQASKEVLEVDNAEIWWASKNLEKQKLLRDYVGKNEKSKLVIKLQKKGHGPPAREPAITEQQKRELMLAEFRRKEELKKLDDDDEDSHLDSQWADNYQLKKSFLGLNRIRFK